MIDINTLKIGEKYFAPVQKWSGYFPNGWKLVECEVVKVNKKSINVAFNRETRKTPQRIIINSKKPATLFCNTKLECWTELLNSAQKVLDKTKDEHSTYYLNKDIKLCQREIKKLLKS